MAIVFNSEEKKTQEVPLSVSGLMSLSGFPKLSKQGNKKENKIISIHFEIVCRPTFIVNALFIRTTSK